MSFLRTISGRRLLAVIVGAVCAGGLGSAIAIAATADGPVPASASLADALHGALQGNAVTGVSANVTFTNNLFSGSSFGTSDPLVTGASGRLWASNGHLRIELQSDNGDGQIVLNGQRFWAYDPTSNTVYEGALPPQASHPATAPEPAGTLPSVSAIEQQLNRLRQHVDVSGATPGDVGGQPAYTVSLTPKTSAGLIGSAALSFDANHAVPLDFSIYPRGDTTPALALQATSVTYGAVPLSDFQISPPAGAQVVHISLPQHSAGAPASASASASGHDVQVLGKGLSSVIVVKHPSSANAQTGSGSAGPLPLQTVTIAGARAQQLSTSLGTVLAFTREGVSYLLAGSVTSATLDSVARGL